MNVIDGFLATWSLARQTFGEGTPESGEQFDQSTPLRRMQADVESAAPGSRWTGAAANAYSAVNAAHAKVFGELADLDRRLAAHVNESAAIVSTGRKGLDSLRQWVIDAAATVPPGKDRDRMLLPIASTGLSQLREILLASNGDLNGVATKIRALGTKYDELATDQKFGKGEDAPSDIQMLTGDKEADQDARKRAEQDVQDTLAGDQDAAKRVRDVINTIRPGDELTAEQGSYLSQMIAQQNGMTVKELNAAEQRLGDQQGVIADSWQLMSNDELMIPHTDTKVDALDNPNYRVRGGMDQLPRSVQAALNDPGELQRIDDTSVLRHGNELQGIAQIVQDGNPELQKGTVLDRSLMDAADTIMDAEGVPQANQANVVQDLFEATSRDHQVVHDRIVGADGSDFMDDINRMSWNDDGTAAGSLFGWTNEAHAGPEAGIASETAETYAQFIGSHKDDLMQMSDGDTLGQRNPELVKAYAHGLTPYMDDIASISGAGKDGDNFGLLDFGNSERPIAKGLFAVLGTERDAYVEFNSAADQMGLERAHSWAEDVKHGVPVSADDARLLDGAILKGLVASGTAEGLHAIDMNNAEAFKLRQDAYNAGVAGLGAFGGPGGAAAATAFGAVMQESMIGAPPDSAAGVIPDMTDDESARYVVNALLADGVVVPGLDDEYLVDVFDEDGNKLPYQQVGSIPELNERYGDYSPSDTEFQQKLNETLNSVLLGAENNPSAKFADKYTQITKIPGSK